MLKKGRNKMKKTEYTTITSWGMNNYNGTSKRVYTDGEKYYIRDHGEYVCISGTPAEKMMSKD